MTKINQVSRFSEQLLGELRNMKTNFESLEHQARSDSKLGEIKSNASFMDHLVGGIQEVDQSQKVSDKLSTELAAGRSDNIHETMLAATKAELNFNLLVQVRNKVLEAYQEVMRMQI